MNRSRRNRITPLIIISSGIILIAIALIFGFSSGGNPSQGTATPLTRTDDVPRISLEEAKTAFDSGEALFLDVRDPDSFMSGHIPGSVSMPLAELPDRIDELPVDRLIITY